MKFLHVSCLLLLAASVCGCKIEFTIPQHGQVESASGTYICNAGDTCVVDVVDAFFDEVFVAKPVAGYSFTAWRTKPNAFCGGRQSPCPLSTTLFFGTPLMQFLESDSTFFLEPVFGKSNTWSQRAGMGIGGVGLASCTIRGKIYATGLGWGIGAFDINLGRTEEYDPVSNVWTPRAELPTPRAWVTASAVGNKCYVIGGGENGGPFSPPALTSVEEYDPRTDNWQSKAPLPQRREAAGSAVVNGKIYVIGGGDAVWWASDPIAPVAIYDPATDTWSEGADMPTPRKGLGVAAVDGLIYAIGGSNHELGIFASGIVEAYDPVADKWSSLASLPADRNFLSAAALKGKLYAMGGLIDSGDLPGANLPASNAVFRYDPKNNQWTRRKGMLVPRYGAAATVLDGQIYVIGGREFAESTAMEVTEEYTP